MIPGTLLVNKAIVKRKPSKKLSKIFPFCFGVSFMLNLREVEGGKEKKEKKEKIGKRKKEKGKKEMERITLLLQMKNSHPNCNFAIFLHFSQYFYFIPKLDALNNICYYISIFPHEAFHFKPSVSKLLGS